MKQCASVNVPEQVVCLSNKTNHYTKGGETEMPTYLLKGVLIGLLFGLPVGAVGTMTIQHTWKLGFKAGLLTGLGSSVADCLYAVVGVFGLTIISDFLLQYRTVINILGSGLILFLGIRLILKKEETTPAQTNAIGRAKMFLSSFAIGITNPAAILTFLFAFSYFGISDVNGVVEAVGLVCGVFIGTYIWWGTLSMATCTIKKKMKSGSFRYMNRVFGSVLTVFGLVILVRGII